MTGNKIVASAGHFHLGHRRGSWIALKEGWFAEDDLDVDIIATGHDELTLEGLMAGRIDVTLDTRTDTFLRARAKGDDVYIIGGFRNTFPNQILAAKGISSISELRGKRIGVTEPEGIDARHVRNVLEEHGFDPLRDVTYIRSGKDPHKADDLRRGAVDAVSVGENAPLLAADGFPVLVDFNKVYPNGYQERVLVVTGKTLRERPEALVAFMKGYLRGNRFMMHRPNGRRVLDYTYSLLESDRLRGGEWAAEAERDWPSCQKEDCTRFPVPVDGSISLEGLGLVMQDEKAAGKLPADMRAEDCVRLEFVEAAQRKVDARFGAGQYA